MTRTRDAILLGALLVLVALAFDAPALDVPGVALVLLGVACELWVRAAARDLSVERELARTRAVEEEPIDIGVVIRSATIGAPSGELDDPFLDGRRALLRPGRRAQRIRIRASFARRGRRRLGPPTVIVRDPLGMTTRRVTGGQAAELLILGRLIEQALAPLQSTKFDQEFVDANVLGLSGFLVSATPRGPADGKPTPPAQFEALVLADDRREYQAVAGPGGSQTDMAAIVAALAKPVAPEGAPALLGMIVDLTGIVASGGLGAVASDRPLPQVSAELALRATAQGELTIEATLPAQRAATLLREADIRSLPIPDGSGLATRTGASS